MNIHDVIILQRCWTQIWKMSETGQHISSSAKTTGTGSRRTDIRGRRGA